jgi:Lrp/AsnC family transcriptional regulator, leucine-responsive regulatory protein
MVQISKVKLDKADRIILAELDKNCRAPASSIAKRARKSRQSVEYRIKRLVESGVITSFNAAINPHRMGFKIYKIYLRLRNVPSERERLFSFLRASGIVYWMGVCDGAWDLIFGVMARSDYEFYALKNSLMSDYGNIIVDKYYDVLVDVRQYPKMYFTGERSEPVMFAGKMAKGDMDALDHGILGEIVNNARMPLTALASKVGSSPPTVAMRMRRMEKMGIIIQYRIGVNLDALGLEYYKAIFHLERYTEDDEKRLLEYMSGLPNTQYYIRNIGDIEPELVVEDYHEYRDIIDSVRREFPFVIRNTSFVLMKSDEWTPGYRNLLRMASGSG